MLKVDDVADLLGISRELVYIQVRRGTFLEPIRIGRLFRWEREAFMKWVKDGCPKPKKRKRKKAK